MKTDTLYWVRNFKGLYLKFNFENVWSKYFSNRKHHENCKSHFNKIYNYYY